MVYYANKNIMEFYPYVVRLHGNRPIEINVSFFLWKSEKMPSRKLLINMIAFNYANLQRVEYVHCCSLSFEIIVKKTEKVKLQYIKDSCKIELVNHFLSAKKKPHSKFYENLAEKKRKLWAQKYR